MVPPVNGPPVISLLLAACTLGLDPYGDTGPVDDTDVADTVDHTDAETDRPDDTGDVAATGLVGGLVEMSRLQIACPACFGAAAELVVSASAAFHEPADRSWFSGYPDRGSCAVNRVGDPPTTERLDVGEWAYLTSGSTSIGLRRTVGASGVMYTADGLSEADFRSTAAYGLTVPDGGDLGPLDVSDAVTTPQGFDSIEPIGLLYTNPSSAFAEPLRRAGPNTFTWSGSGGSGDFVVQIDVYDPDGAALIGTVACRGPDNGALTVPGTMLAAYPAYSLLAVYLYRLETGGFVLDANGATVETSGIIGVIGTGYLAQ
jgi:hypothetical protein